MFEVWDLWFNQITG